MATAIEWEDVPRRCESLAQLTVEMAKMLKYPVRDPAWRFVLVLDSVDKQRDAPVTLLPALARLSEIVSPRKHTLFLSSADRFSRSPVSPASSS